MLNVVTIIIAAMTMLGLALIMGMVLGWAARAFKVEVDERIERINDILPAVNCGGCDYIGCMEYAEAVVNDNESVSKCCVGGSAVAEQIASIMGVEAGEKIKVSPVIHCAGDLSKKLGRVEYKGEETCSAANIVPGLQSCTYGCIGFGDCSSVCPYSAIIIRNGLAVINYDKCVGCGACAKACPRGILSMVPFKSDQIYVVACSNRDAAKEVRSACQIGCIGCSLCTKASNSFYMEGKVARLKYSEYDKKDDLSAAAEKCPRKCILEVGTARESMSLKDDENPEAVDADFSSSVENLEWRG